MKIILYLKKNYSILLIILIGFIFIGRVTVQHKWPYTSKIIEWDVKSYYAYLPATFIYNDLTFEFIYNDKNSESLRNDIWPIRVDKTGKLIIKTSMGMSYIYLPAFFVAHISAKALGYDATGYSKPYDISIIYLAIIYLLLGLIYLRKLLAFLKFNELSILITLIAVSVGTNLTYYTIYESGMTHVFNFTLITIFTYNTVLWWKKKQIKNLIFIGLLGGLITLIRPTNILIYLIFVFWSISSLVGIKERLIYFFKNIKIPILLVLLYLVSWIPQLIFWKIQTGHFLYFSYGDGVERFFFSNPQIFNILFSYWKGWYIYTPVMLVATLGLITLFKKNKGQSILILLYLSIIIYVLSSWWAWWFGGGYGNRAFIDFYGIMAIPLASIIMYFLKQKFAKVPFFILFFTLIWYNNFQITQYRTGALHYYSMTKEMYWEQFMIKNRTDHFREIVMIPDYKAAHHGVFRLIPEDNNKKKIEPAKYGILDLKDNKIKTLSEKDYFENSDLVINHALQNRIDSVVLYRNYKIEATVYNNILNVKADSFISSGIESIILQFDIDSISKIKEECKLAISVESRNQKKYIKYVDITQNSKINDTIELPLNTVPTDDIKIYIWQKAYPRSSFITKNCKLFFKD